jgi:hypothetical protein
VMAPMLQESLGDRGYAPVGGIAQAPPPLHVAADLVDERVFGVGFQVEGSLPGGRFFPGGRNRDNEAGWTTPLPWFPFKWLTVLVERMMQFRRAIGRVEDRPLVKAVWDVPLLNYPTSP